MSETKRQYTDGKNSFLVTDAEAAELNRGRPAYLPPILPVDDAAKIRVNYENADGEVVDEMVPATNVLNRAQLGENIVATPETIEASRVSEQIRTRKAMADEENALAFGIAALPGGQFAARAAVGEEDATQGLTDLAQENPFANLAGNAAEFAMGTVALGGIGRLALGADRARKIGVLTGINPVANAGKALGLKKAGQVAMGEALVETHMYVQNQIDTNGPFVAEDWAQQVATGMILASPFISGAALRGTVQSVKTAMGAEGINLLGTARTAMTTGAVIAGKGAQSMKYARGAAASGLVQKLLRKVTKRGVAQTDEVATKARQVGGDYIHARDQITPAKLDGMTPTKRTAALEEYRRYGMEPNLLDEVDFPNMVTSIKKMGQSVNKVRAEALKMHRKLHGNGVADVKMTNKARDLTIRKANELLAHVEDAGMIDVKNAIQRGIINGGGDVPTMHKALIEAKVNARFRRGVDGGADIVDDMLTNFLRDNEVFDARTIRINNEIIGAVDDLVQVWDDLGDIRVSSRAKDFETFGIPDGAAIGKNQDAVARMRSAVDTLTEKGLLSAEQRAAFETVMVDASDGIARGTVGMADAIKVNRARNNSLGKLKKELDLVGEAIDTPESFGAAQMASAMETGAKMLKWSSGAIDALLATRPMQAGAAITAAIHGMPPEEKRAVFEVLHGRLVELSGNPLAMTESMTPFIDRGAQFKPQHADHAAMKATNTIMYLQSQLPPVDDTVYGRGAPQPLSSVEEFLEKFMAASDPVAVGYELYAGTITPEMVNSLRATNPAIYAEMSADLAYAMSQVPSNQANPQVLAAAGIFMGGLDPLYSGDFIAKIQSNYAQTATQDEVINGPRRPMQNPDPSRAATTSQRQQTY